MTPYYAPPTLFRNLRCAHCLCSVSWPRWIRVDHGFYQALCWTCFPRIDADFTAAAAVAEAQAIVRGVA